MNYLILREEKEIRPFQAELPEKEES